MNPTLFKSPHLVVAVLICAGFMAWMVLDGIVPGPVRGNDVGFLLWTGWVAFGLMVLVCLYAARKYVHRVSWSPEFRLRVPLAALERVEGRLNDLRRKIAQGALSSAREIRQLAATALREERVEKVMVAVVEKGDVAAGEPAFRIVARPTERLGRMLPWLHAHAYYGIASGVIVWLHGGGKMDEPLGIAMNALTLVVIVTGVLGWLLWAFGPRWLTRAETDLNYEQQFVLAESLDEKIEAASAKLAETPDVHEEVRKAARKGGSEDSVERELATALQRSPDARPLLQDIMVLVGQRRRIQRGLSRLDRLYRVMNLWRALHVPLSILLMVVVFVHVLQVWWY